MGRSRLLGAGLVIAGLVVGVLSMTGASTPSLEVAPIVAARGVVPDATADNGQRKLARAEDGTLYLAFSAVTDEVEQAQVYFSLDDGQSWKPEVTLAQPGVWSDLATLATGPDGRLDAAWVDYTTVGNVWYGSRQDGVWSEFEKISPGDTYAGYPAMDIIDDSPNVLWYAAPPDADRAHGSAYEIMHSRLADGSWTTPELLSSNSDDALNPASARGPDGTFYGSWFEMFQGSYTAQVAEFDGEKWTDPIRISLVAKTSTGVSIDAAGDGTVHLVWEQADGDEFGVGYARLADGQWSAPEMLSDVVSQDPVVASDSSGRVIVAWSEDGEIKARFRDGAWSETTSLGPGTNPTSVSGDRVLLAWTRQAGSGHEVVTSYVETGSAGGPSNIAVLVAAGALVVVGAVLLLRRPVVSGGGADA